jgi:thiol-disulfide isomerase/thioredoxin
MIKSIAYIFILSSSLLFRNLLAQDTFEVYLEGQIFSTASDSVSLLQDQGDNKYGTVYEFQLGEQGHFAETVKFLDKDYYILQLSDGQRLNLIIEGPDTIKVYGNGKRLFFESNIVGSEASTEMNNFIRANYVYQARLDSVNNYLKQNQDKRNEIQQSFMPIYHAFEGEKKQFMARNSKSPALLALLPTFDIQNEFPLYERTVEGLNAGFGESPTVKRIVKQLEINKEKLESKKPLSPGSEAKEIALPNPEGDTLRLSDYKGKVVLLDFWASWCGPCRRENPNVVKLYQKYKKDGFEVFSVSLDKSKEGWERAIEQDGLIWEGHVSDLKYWNSAAARKYNVSSIPFTVLIDKEGKIINTRLRGAQLESVLMEIFGY